MTELRRVLEEREKVLGLDREEAETMFRQALVGQEMVFGHYHEKTQISKESLEKAHQKTG